ncbi:MAG: hypothetical protein KC502_16415 [Myxococcales bacterium]|nr:hypothetical protein [Myxococcales bacterium]
MNHRVTQFALVSLALAGLLSGCSLDDGRSLADYRLEFAALADVTISDGTSAGADSKTGGLADTAMSDTGDIKLTDSMTTDSGAADTHIKDTAQLDTGPADVGPPPKDGCSGPDGPKYVINILNTTKDRHLIVGWNDKDCKEIILGKVKPGKAVNLTTHIGRWVIIRIEPNNDLIRQFRVTKTTSTKLNVP